MLARNIFAIIFLISLEFHFVNIQHIFDILKLNREGMYLFLCYHEMCAGFHEGHCDCENFLAENPPYSRL